MVKNKLKGLWLLAALVSLAGCAAGQSRVAPTKPGSLEPSTFRKVEVATIVGMIYTGKVVGFQDNRLAILPYPYWNVEEVHVDLEKIAVVKLKRNPGESGSSKAGHGAAIGFAVGFLLAGTIGLFTGEYDEDFQDSIMMSFVLGAAFGLCGLGWGAAAGLPEEKEFDFSKMSRKEKIRTIKKVMGLRVKRRWLP
jgi:hypothetical protein